jgi:LmbE family N-acetylglucosaminyl deacetylase
VERYFTFTGATRSGAKPVKIMTVFAHPADTITNCGGTLARHADRGDEVVALILTHGGRIHANKYVEEWRKDQPDESVTAAGLAEIIATKKAELARAAEIIGIGKVITLDHDDARCTVDEDVVDQIAAHVADFAPDVVIMDYPKNPNTPDPHTHGQRDGAQRGQPRGHLHAQPGRPRGVLGQADLLRGPAGHLD